MDTAHYVTDKADYIGRKRALTRDRYHTITLIKNPSKGKLGRGASMLFSQRSYVTIKDLVFLKVVSNQTRI